MIVDLCGAFTTEGDGWSDQMHSVVTINGETLTVDQFAWDVVRHEAELNGYTYRVVVTDDRLPSYNFDTGVVTVPKCGIVSPSPPVHHDTPAPTKLPSTGFFIDLLLVVAAAFIIIGLVIRFASRRTHL